MLYMGGWAVRLLEPDELAIELVAGVLPGHGGGFDPPLALVSSVFGVHRFSGWLCRTELTTSSIAWVVAPAYFCSATSASWVAPAITRCTLLVDSVAVLSCAVIHAASCPTLAVRTARGLSPKSRREAASWVEALARRYSSTVLRTVLAFAVLARTSSLERGGRVPKET